MKSEFDKLVKENAEIRFKLNELIGLNNPLYSPIWEQIHILIENEIKQEDFCNG